MELGPIAILLLRAAQGSHIINKARGSLLTAIYSVMSSGRVGISNTASYMEPLYKYQLDNRGWHKRIK